MAAAHVEHVVGQVSAGRVIGDHREAVGGIGARSLRDVCPVDERGRSDGIEACCFLGSRDDDFLAQRGDRELEMQN